MGRDESRHIRRVVVTDLGRQGVDVLVDSVDDGASPLHAGDLVVAASGEPGASILDLAARTVIELRGDAERHIGLDD